MPAKCLLSTGRGFIAPPPNILCRKLEPLWFDVWTPAPQPQRQSCPGPRHSHRRPRHSHRRPRPSLHRTSRKFRSCHCRTNASQRNQIPTSVAVARMASLKARFFYECNDCGGQMHHECIYESQQCEREHCGKDPATGDLVSCLSRYGSRDAGSAIGVDSTQSDLSGYRTQQVAYCGHVMGARAQAAARIEVASSLDEGSFATADIILSEAAPSQPQPQLQALPQSQVASPAQPQATSSNVLEITADEVAKRVLNSQSQKLTEAALEDAACAHLQTNSSNVLIAQALVDDRNSHEEQEQLLCSINDSKPESLAGYVLPHHAERATMPGTKAPRTWGTCHVTIAGPNEPVGVGPLPDLSLHVSKGGAGDMANETILGNFRRHRLEELEQNKATTRRQPQHRRQPPSQPQAATTTRRQPHPRAFQPQAAATQPQRRHLQKRQPQAQQRQPQKRQPQAQKRQPQKRRHRSGDAPRTK